MISPGQKPRIFAAISLLVAALLVIIGRWIFELDLAGLIVVVVFYYLIFAIGIWAGDKSDENKTDNFLLAGRKLPLWISVFTMAATWIGGGFINGTAEFAASSGLLWVQAPWGYAVSLIIGGLFFARKMRRYQFRTMLDPLEQRFGDKSTGLFFIPAVMGEIFWIAAILTALGTTFSIILGLNTDSAIIISALVAIIYTGIGGLKSVAYTDIVQLGLLILGLLLVLPIVLSAAGGMSEVWPLYVEKHGSAASLLPDYESMGNYFWNWWDFALLLMLGGIPWQVYFQRVLAAKNEKTAMWLSIAAGVICMLVATPAAMIGMVGGVTDWASMGLEGPETAAHTLPYVFKHLTHPWVALLGLASLAAAVMSSIDSSILSASSLSAWNVYRPLIKPDLKDEELSKMIKRFVYIIGITATFLSLKVESVYALWYLCSDFVYCLLFPALVCALFDPKANKAGAIAGFVVAAILRFGGGEPILGIPIMIPYPMVEDGVVLFPFRSLAMVSGLLSILLVSRLTQKQFPPKPLKFVKL